MHAYSNLNEHQINESRSDQDLRSIFNTCFANEFNTVLEGNASEPLYTPAISTHGVHTIFYRHDYFSSALHEIAHWCIAGKQRRQQIDYGYWYAEDGRSARQQLEFEKVELKPQAIEWAFSLASGIPFRVSIDNLQAFENTDHNLLHEQHKRFTKAVKSQLNHYIENGFPHRAQIFLNTLNDFYRTSKIAKLHED